MSEWQETELGLVCDRVTGRLNSNAAALNGKYPFFTCSPETLTIDDYAFDTEALLLAGNNANGVFPLKYYKGKFNAYQRTYVITPKDPAEFDIKFLYYQLNLRLNYFKEISQGTATKFLTAGILDNLPVLYPEHAEQQTIAEILSSLDEKIELNRKQNRTLEAIAQALFKRWFVEFEFPDENGRPYKSSGGAMQPSELGEIPVGWEVAPLSTLVDINSWTLSAKDDLEYIDYIEISEVNRGDINQISTYQRGMEPSRARRRLKHGDSAISTVRPDRGAHFLALNPEKHLIASTGFAVLTGRKIPWSLVNAFITQDSVSTELGRLADGGAYPAVRPEVIGRFPMVVPKTGRLLDQFHAICSPLYEKAGYNRKASKSLGTIRDTILPKLMSGELRVA